MNKKQKNEIKSECALKNYTIALLGRTKWLLKTGELLHKNGFKIKLIITSKNAEWDPITPKDIEKFAKKINAKFILTENINSVEIIKQIKKLNLDLACSTNNRLLISNEIISSFKKGILNAHPGDLPRYRGNACPNWAILKNEKEIGLTIHFMSKKLDSGDICKKKYFKINDSTTMKDVYDFLDEEIPKLYLEVVKKITTKKLKISKQNEKKMLRVYPRNEIDGKINWNSNVDHIHKIIRISGFPYFGAYTYLGSEKLIILKAKKEYPDFEFFSENGQVIERRKNGEVVVTCLDGFLILTKVKYKNNIYEKPTKIIKTIHTRLGMNIEGEIEKIIKKLDKITKKLNKQE